MTCCTRARSCVSASDAIAAGADATRRDCVKPRAPAVAAMAQDEPFIRSSKRAKFVIVPRDRSDDALRMQRYETSATRFISILCACHVGSEAEKAQLGFEEVFRACHYMVIYKKADVMYDIVRRGLCSLAINSRSVSHYERNAKCVVDICIPLDKHRVARGQTLVSELSSCLLERLVPMRWRRLARFRVQLEETLDPDSLWVEELADTYNSAAVSYDAMKMGGGAHGERLC